MIKLCMALTACIMLLTTGCSAEAEPAIQMAETARYVTSAAPQITVEQILNEYNSSRKAVAVQVEEDDAYAPVAVVRCVCQIGDSYIVFPKVESEAGEVINSAICTAVMDRAEYIGIPVFTDYRVEYNRDGIFSIRMFLYDMYGEEEACIDCVPLTFNSETGELYRISDFFDSEDQHWRGRIPDIITAQAADNQMVLLSDILPISDDRPFYITDEAVVIMYDLYEIATYSAGEPEFEIPVDDIAECLDDASVLNAMLPTEPVEAETITEPAETEAAPMETPAQQPEETPVQPEVIEEQPEEQPHEGEDIVEQPGETIPAEGEESGAEPAMMSENEELPVTEEVQ